MKYRAVLQRMALKNAAAFAVCCVMIGTSAVVGAEAITYDDAKAAGGTGLQTATIGGATYTSLFPGTPTAPGASGNTVTVDYTSGAGKTNPYRVFGGLSNSATVTGNTVNFLKGTVTNIRQMARITGLSQARVWKA